MMETLDSPPVIPKYNKPESPGIWMNFDNTVSIYMIIGREMGFLEAAQAAFLIIKDAQERFPDWPRSFYLDIENHKKVPEKWIEFQQEFWFSALAPFLTSFELPLTGPLLNPNLQQNNLPDSLIIK